MARFRPCLYTIQERLGRARGTLCDSHFPELSGGGSLCSECPHHRLCCGLAGVAEGTGDGSDGRKTSFMLAEAALVPVPLALSCRPSTGDVSLHIYFGGRGCKLPARIEAHSEDMTPGNIQQSLAASLHGSQDVRAFSELLSTTGDREKDWDGRGLVEGTSGGETFTTFGTMLFTKMIRRLLDAQQFPPRTLRGL